MVSKIVDIGAKVDIRIVAQIENASQIEQEAKVYKSQVYDLLENGEMELLMPIEGGKLQLLSLGLRYEFLFYTKSGMYKAIGQVKERYKSDNIYMIRIELHTPLSKFQRRQFFRMQCIMDMKYYPVTKEQVDENDAEDIEDKLRRDGSYKHPKTGHVVDISGGGVRFVSEEENPSDSYVLMQLCLNGDRQEQYTIIGHIIRCERAEKSSVAGNRYENRVEFVLKDVRIQEKIIRYIFAEERKARKNDV